MMLLIIYIFTLDCDQLFNLVLENTPILLNEHALLLLGEHEGLILAQCVLAFDQALIHHVAREALVWLLSCARACLHRCNPSTLAKLKKDGEKRAISSTFLR